MQMDDDPLRPWNPAEWKMLPVKRPPSVVPKVRRVPWVTVAFTVYVAACLFLVGVCVWLMVWAVQV